MADAVLILQVINILATALLGGLTIVTQFCGARVRKSKCCGGEIELKTTPPRTPEHPNTSTSLV